MTILEGILKLFTFLFTTASLGRFLGSSDGGKMTIFYGSQGIIKQRRREKKEEDKWRMRSGYKSPFYTTNWNDILKVS